MISSGSDASSSQIGQRVFRQRRMIDGLKRLRQFEHLRAAETELDALLDQLRAADMDAEIEASR